MGTSAKILKFIFIILLLVTLGEVGYYIYVSNAKDTKSIVTNDKAIPSVAIQATSNNKIVDPETYNKYIKSVETAFKRAKQNKDLKLSLVFEQKGLVSIFLDKENNNKPSITIVDENGQKIFSLGENYNQHLFKVENGEKRQITINEVKNGNKITDIEYFNVYNSTSSAEVLIYD